MKQNTRARGWVPVTSITRSAQSSLNQISPLTPSWQDCARKFLHLLGKLIPALFWKRLFFFVRRTIPKTRLWFPARVERWRNIPVGWRWEASNKVPGPCGEGCELLWSSYISKLLAELLQIAAISTPAAQSSADGVSARVRPHQSETAYPPEGSRGRAGGWGIIVSASKPDWQDLSWLAGSLDGRHQCVVLTEDESRSWIIDWIWMHYWRSFNWKHLHVL